MYIFLTHFTVAYIVDRAGFEPAAPEGNGFTVRLRKPVCISVDRVVRGLPPARFFVFSFFGLLKASLPLQPCARDGIRNRTAAMTNGFSLTVFRFRAPGPAVQEKCRILSLSRPDGKELHPYLLQEYLRRGSNPQKTRILSPAHIPILLQRHILLWGCGHAAKYSRRDSNPHCTGPGPASSSNWDYGSIIFVIRRPTGLEPAYGGITSRCMANSATAAVSPARLERASNGS